MRLVTFTQPDTDSETLPRKCGKITARSTHCERRNCSDSNCSKFPGEEGGEERNGIDEFIDVSTFVYN